MCVLWLHAQADSSLTLPAPKKWGVFKNSALCQVFSFLRVFEWVLEENFEKI